MKRIAFFALIGLVMPAFRAVADPPTPTPTAEPEGTVAGFPIHRANGGWLGIEVKDQNFWMTFYNEKKKPIAADASAAVLWWTVPYQSNPERTELTASSKPSVLASAYTIRPPYAFKLHITVLSDANAGAATSNGAAPPAPEAYVVDYSG